MEPLSVYIEHFLAGLVFAASGAYASQWCRHTWHRLTVGVILVAVETAVIVSIVG
jgi:hypothetical protein